MKKSIIPMLMMAPLLALADGPPAFGLSGQVVERRYEFDTKQLLDQQSQSAPAARSELSAPLYVDSQRRIADTFKQAIPEDFGEDQTRGDE
ncbi:hypothetical protein CEK62_17090 [Alcanivorax sp. N3-2A]|nr:hypothetical protein CEK62_17090 [Alcanivorax sp. N3-2A]|tara:strand:+ start:27006 stop:27278 length:273 start_codon:yes stop_codon:yes gene_type:complete